MAKKGRGKGASRNAAQRIETSQLDESVDTGLPETSTEEAPAALQLGPANLQLDQTIDTGVLQESTEQAATKSQLNEINDAGALQESAEEAPTNFQLEGLQESAVGVPTKFQLDETIVTGVLQETAEEAPSMDTELWPKRTEETPTMHRLDETIVTGALEEPPKEASTTAENKTREVVVVTEVAADSATASMLEEERIELGALAKVAENENDEKAQEKEGVASMDTGLQQKKPAETPAMHQLDETIVTGVLEESLEEAPTTAEHNTREAAVVIEAAAESATASMPEQERFELGALAKVPETEIYEEEEKEAGGIAEEVKLVNDKAAKIDAAKLGPDELTDTKVNFFQELARAEEARLALEAAAKADEAEVRRQIFFKGSIAKAASESPSSVVTGAEAGNEASAEVEIVDESAAKLALAAQWNSEDEALLAEARVKVEEGGKKQEEAKLAMLRSMQVEDQVGAKVETTATPAGELDSLASLVLAQVEKERPRAAVPAQVAAVPAQVAAVPAQVAQPLEDHDRTPKFAGDAPEKASGQEDLELLRDSEESERAQRVQLRESLRRAEEARVLVEMGFNMEDARIAVRESETLDDAANKLLEKYGSTPSLWQTILRWFGADSCSLAFRVGKYKVVRDGAIVDPIETNRSEETAHGIGARDAQLDSIDAGTIIDIMEIKIIEHNEGELVRGRMTDGRWITLASSSSNEVWAMWISLRVQLAELGYTENQANEAEKRCSTIEGAVEFLGSSEH